MAGTPVILVPGVVLPAALAYPGLVAALGDGFECVPKELEVYAGPEPPNGFGLDTEVEGIALTAQQSGFERSHLVGYSGWRCVAAGRGLPPTRPLDPGPAGLLITVQATRNVVLPKADVVESTEADRPQASSVSPVSDDVPAIPMDTVALNRAERREQQRQQAQAKRKRPVRTAAPATT